MQSEMGVHVMDVAHGLGCVFWAEPGSLRPPPRPTGGPFRHAPISSITLPLNICLNLINLNLKSRPAQAPGQLKTPTQSACASAWSAEDANTGKAYVSYVAPSLAEQHRAIARTVFSHLRSSPLQDAAVSGLATWDRKLGPSKTCRRVDSGPSRSSCLVTQARHSPRVL